MSKTWWVSVDPHLCVGSATCLYIAPGMFVLNGGTAKVAHFEPEQMEQVRTAAESCPVGAIIIVEKGEDVHG